MGIQFSSSLLARANMRSFVALCLVAAAAGSPAKLGQAHRQGRQGGYIAPVEEQAAYGNTAAASTVVVMEGSYSYVGADGNTWTVDWYADETGYHPSAPHLPVPVEPLFPEIKAAVEAQLRFAAEEDAAAAASSRSESYAAALSVYE